VPETLVITGAGVAVVEMDTLSNVAVARVEVLPLETARPTYTLCAIVIVWLVPCCVQFTPSGDLKALKLFPLRTSFTHSGTVILPGTEEDVAPPVLVR
jgi:hypothetical protein